MMDTEMTEKIEEKESAKRKGKKGAAAKGSVVALRNLRRYDEIKEGNIVIFSFEAVW